MERIKIAQLDDRQLDELLVYAPDFSAQNSENIKRKFLQKAAASSPKAAKPAKRRTLRHVLLAAAIAAMAMATSITVLAATGVIDIKGFYNSIFSNRETSSYLILGDAALVGDGISDAGDTAGIVITGSGVDAPGSGGMLTVEPVVAFISHSDWDNYFFDLYIQLKLTSEDKLQISDDFDGLYIHQKYANEYGIHDVQLNTYGPTEVTFIDENTVLVSFRTHAFSDNFQIDKKAGTLTFGITAFSPEHHLYTYPEFGNDGGSLIPRDEEYPITDGTTYYGDWEIVIDTKASSAIETVYIDGNFNGYDALVRINATSVNVRLERETETSEPWPWKDGSNIKVTFSDGRVVESPYVENFGDSLSIEYWGNIPFVNPNDVVKVELFDETVFSLTDG